MRVELGDHYVILKDPMEVTNGERKEAVAAYSAAIADPAIVLAASRDFATFDALLKAMIIEWSYDMPLPKTDPASLDKLPINDANTLYEALRPMVALLFPDFSPNPNPKVPTAALAATDGR